MPKPMEKVYFETLFFVTQFLKTAKIMSIMNMARICCLEWLLTTRSMKER